MIYVEALCWDDICKLYDELHDNLGYSMQLPRLKYYNALEKGQKVYVRIDKPLVFYALSFPCGDPVYPFDRFMNVILPTWKTRRLIQNSCIYRDYAKDCLQTIIGGCA